MYICIFRTCWANASTISAGCRWNKHTHNIHYSGTLSSSLMIVQKCDDPNYMSVQIMIEVTRWNVQSHLLSRINRQTAHPRHLQSEWLSPGRGRAQFQASAGSETAQPGQHLNHDFVGDAQSCVQGLQSCGGGIHGLFKAAIHFSRSQQTRFISDNMCRNLLGESFHHIGRLTNTDIRKKKRR